MHLADLGSVRSLVGKVTKLLGFKSLELTKIPGHPMAIVRVNVFAGLAISINLSKYNRAGVCA